MRVTRRILPLWMAGSWLLVVVSVCSFVPDNNLATHGSVADGQSRAIQKRDGHERCKPIDTRLRALDTDVSSEDGGNELSPYYRRDRLDSPEQPVADPIGLGRLLEERHCAHCHRNATAVAEIDRVLWREHGGVRVYDQPAIWTRRKEPPRSYQRRQVQRQVARMKDMYGPTGHPYAKVGVSQSEESNHPLFCALDHAAVHALLSRQCMCRAAGRYEEADAIQFELWVHGVHVHDKSLQWTMDRSQSLMCYDAAVERDKDSDSMEQIRSPVYAFRSVNGTAATDSLPDDNNKDAKTAQRTLQRIHHLLAERADALVRSEERVVAFLSLELLRTYRVRVDDDQRVWWFVTASTQDASSSSFLQTLDKMEVAAAPFPALLFATQDADYCSPVRYRESDYSLGHVQLPHSFLGRVQHLVQERIHKREEAKYVEADALRHELWQTYNVGVNDRLQQFSVGGVYDERPPTQHQFV